MARSVKQRTRTVSITNTRVAVYVFSGRMGRAPTRGRGHGARAVSVHAEYNTRVRPRSPVDGITILLVIRVEQLDRMPRAI
jgi:hypothetical protein